MTVGEAARRAAAGLLAAGLLAAGWLPGVRHAPRPGDEARRAAAARRGAERESCVRGLVREPRRQLQHRFGYFNRNHQEHVDIAVGPDNRIEPGPADRGQPTHFLPRRQTGVFAVRVRPISAIGS